MGTQRPWALQRRNDWLGLNERSFQPARAKDWNGSTVSAAAFGALLRLPLVAHLINHQHRAPSKGEESVVHVHARDFALIEDAARNCFPATT